MVKNYDLLVQTCTHKHRKVTLTILNQYTP